LPDKSEASFLANQALEKKNGKGEDTGEKTIKATSD
jgi:hypothetical protein